MTPLQPAATTAPTQTGQPSPPLIGLTGAAGAGKTSLAMHLEARHGFERFAFADPILAMLLALCNEAGIESGWATERIFKEAPMPVLGVSYRRMAQTLGTEWGRQMLGADLWIRVAQQRLDNARLHGAPVVVSDVRFPNEADWIRQQGGVIVRLVRSGTLKVAPHQSEDHSAGLAVEYTLLNNGSLQRLHDNTDDLLADIVHLRGAVGPNIDTAAA